MVFSKETSAVIPPEIGTGTLAQRFFAFSSQTLAGRKLGTDFDRESFENCGREGLLTLLKGEHRGVRRTGLQTIITIFEALGAGGADRGFLFAVGAHLFGCQYPLALHGSNSHHGRWVEEMSAGRAVGALAITEPTGGTVIGQMQTLATPKSDGYVLNGCKVLVTNAPHADLFLVLAATAPERKSFGLSAFLVERESPGLEVQQQHTSALRGAPMGMVRFNDVALKKDALIGHPHSGLTIFNTAMLWERIGILSAFVGSAEHDLRRCVKFAKERKGPQGPITVHQAVSHRIARAKLRLERSRLMLQHAARIVDEKKSNAQMAVAMAKVEASETIVETAMDVLRIGAGHAWTEEGGPMQLLADAIGTLFASGTTDAQLNIIASGMGLKHK